MSGRAGFPRFTAEFVKRYGVTGRAVGLFGNEQIVYILLIEVIAVYGVPRYLRTGENPLTNPSTLFSGLRDFFEPPRPRASRFSIEANPDRRICCRIFGVCRCISRSHTRLAADRK